MPPSRGARAKAPACDEDQDPEIDVSEEEEEEDKPCTDSDMEGRPMKGGKGPGKAAPKRKRSASQSGVSPENQRQGFRSDKSLGALTKQFVNLVKTSGIDMLDRNKAAAALKVQKRRIYDITNVLEGIGMLEKTSKNQVQWASTPDCAEDAERLQQLRDEMESLAEVERHLDEQIERMKTSLQQMCSVPDNKARLYLTDTTISQLPCFQKDTVLALRAPSEYTLELGSTPSGHFTLKARSTTDTLDVFLVHSADDVDVASNQQPSRVPIDRTLSLDPRNPIKFEELAAFDLVAQQDQLRPQPGPSAAPPLPLPHRQSVPLPASYLADGYAPQVLPSRQSEGAACLAASRAAQQQQQRYGQGGGGGGGGGNLAQAPQGLGLQQQQQQRHYLGTDATGSKRALDARHPQGYLTSALDLHEEQQQRQQRSGMHPSTFALAQQSTPSVVSERGAAVLGAWDDSRVASVSPSGYTPAAGTAPQQRPLVGHLQGPVVAPWEEAERMLMKERVVGVGGDGSGGGGGRMPVSAFLPRAASHQQRY